MAKTRARTRSAASAAVTHPDWGSLALPVLSIIFRHLFEQHDHIYALARCWRSVSHTCGQWRAAALATPLCVEIRGARILTQDVAAWLRLACIEVLAFARSSDEEDPVSSLVASDGFLATSGAHLRMLTDASLPPLAEALARLPRLEKLTVHQDFSSSEETFWPNEPLRCLRNLPRLRALAVSGNMPTFSLAGCPPSLRSLTISLYERGSQLALGLPPELSHLRQLTAKADELCCDWEDLARRCRVLLLCAQTLTLSFPSLEQEAEEGGGEEGRGGERVGAERVDDIVPRAPGSSGADPASFRVAAYRALGAAVLRPDSRLREVTLAVYDLGIRAGGVWDGYSLTALPPLAGGPVMWRGPERRGALESVPAEEMSDVVWEVQFLNPPPPPAQDEAAWNVEGLEEEDAEARWTPARVAANRDHEARLQRAAERSALEHWDQYVNFPARPERVNSEDLLQVLRSQLVLRGWDLSPSSDLFDDFLGDMPSEAECFILELLQRPPEKPRSYTFTTPVNDREAAQLTSQAVWRLSWCEDSRMAALLSSAAFQQLSALTLSALDHIVLEPGLDLRPFQNLTDLTGDLRVAADVQRLLLPPSIKTLSLNLLDEEEHDLRWIGAPPRAGADAPGPAPDEEAAPPAAPVAAMERLSFDWSLMPCQLPSLVDLTLMGFRAARLSGLPSHVTSVRFADPSSPNLVDHECLAVNLTPPRFWQDGLEGPARRLWQQRQGMLVGGEAGQESWTGPVETVVRSGPPNEQEWRAAAALLQRDGAVEGEATAEGLVPDGPDVFFDVHDGEEDGAAAMDVERRGRGSEGLERRDAESHSELEEGEESSSYDGRSGSEGSYETVSSAEAARALQGPDPEAKEEEWGMSAWQWSRANPLPTPWEPGLESEEEEDEPPLEADHRDAERCGDPLCPVHSKLAFLQVSTSQDAVLAVDLGYLVQAGAQLINLAAPYSDNGGLEIQWTNEQGEDHCSLKACAKLLESSAVESIEFMGYEEGMEAIVQREHIRIVDFLRGLATHSPDVWIMRTWMGDQAVDGLRAEGRGYTMVRRHPKAWRGKLSGEVGS